MAISNAINLHFLLPSSVGALDQVITSDGLGGSTWTTLQSKLISWNDVTSSPRNLSVNEGYITNNGVSLVTYILPVTAAQGSIINIAGFSSGGWAISQNSGQSIVLGNVQTTVGLGGGISSTSRGDQVSLLCVVADTTWVALSYIGNITYA